ncbi:hypothetical protein [Frondihabitans sp. VKM Ac-2883]|uniref:hypothetical protein n=1 Tax=Frondihabitans sp. VKM Ac-2883 TaxID=2783823 RepID=UPI00188B63F4|nr:hypothetical protein [Frondihabitans sp. VKM Ac-2883]MBF4577150.1 hypothetical protein [Frondihabitans sp. VKM Ac-2883]
MSNNVPQFLAPSSPARAATPAISEAPPTARQPQLDLKGDEQPLVISNFSFDLPGPTAARDRIKFVRDALAAGVPLSEDGLHAVAKGMVYPEVAASMVKNNLFTNEIVEAATLHSLPAILYTTELFPLLQPRTGASAQSTAAPVISGETGSDGGPTAALELSFQSVRHLADYLRQTVRETRRTGKRYDESILARRVSRPIIAHEAHLTFQDGSEAIDVLVVRDGLTRLVSATAARMKGKPTPEEIAEEMVTTLLTRKSSARTKDLTVSQQYARGRDDAATTLRSRFTLGIAGGEPDEDAIRVGQTFTLPAQVYVGIDPLPGNPLPSDQQFDDAIRAVVSSIHVEFKGWDEAAEFAEVADRAMHRVRHSGELLEDVADLATGIIDESKLGSIFGDTSIPPTPLWRGVYVVATLCNPEVYKGMKRELRAILGLTRIADSRYVSLMAPVVDRPWRGVKAATLAQSRSAWGDGAPIPKGALGLSWKPVPVADFTELIAPALAGDVNARLTLQVAGGIALVTDKLLTANVGSKLSMDLVPFRASVSDVVSGLGTNEYGLWILARAANAFDASGVAANSFTERDLQSNSNASQIASSYRVGMVDPEHPNQFLVDNSGQPRLMREREVVTASNPQRAAKPKQDLAGGASSPTQETDAARAARLRVAIRTGLTHVDDQITELTTIPSGAGIGQPFSTLEEWQELTFIVNKITAGLYQNVPAAGQASSSGSDSDAKSEADGE